MAVDKRGATLVAGDLLTVIARVESVSEALGSNEVVISVQTYPDPEQYSLGQTVVVDGTAVEKAS